MGFRVYVLLLFLLSGCGGFRGGIESVPYVRDLAPQQTSTSRTWQHEITLPGLTLHLSLNNTIQTYQYEVMLYVIPTYLNFRDEFQHRDAESVELTLQITAQGSDVTIDPRQLLLTVDDKLFRPTAVWVNNLQREHQVIDAYVTARRQAPPDQSLPIPSSSEWRDAVTASVTIGPGEKSPRFVVTFPAPLPSPERALSLNLSPAISEPILFDKLHIRFKPRRWSEGYS
jgi:hypothetical protein